MTEINSQGLTQSEKPVDLNTNKTQEGFLSKIFSLMNKNRNYKNLGNTWNDNSEFFCLRNNR